MLQVNRLMRLMVLGPIVPGRLDFGPIPASFLISNGFQSFFDANEMSAYQRAVHTAREVNRQGGVGAAIASFKIDILHEIAYE